MESNITLEQAVIDNNIEWIRQNIQTHKHNMLTTNSDGLTPIDVAVSNNRMEIVELFVQNNLEAVLEKSPCGYTPLEIAIYYKYQGLVEYLTQITDIHEATKEKVKRIMLYGKYNPYSVNKKTHTQLSKKPKSRNTDEDEDFKKPEPVKRISRDLINLLED